MSVCAVIEVNNELYVHISKVGDLGNLKAENDRLYKLISQREKKWEKWTTEKQILSSKMSDYLCKYQNLKREYTKQIKISTDRKKENDRLNNIIYKAIDFLKENACIDEDVEYFCDDLRYDDCKKLLNILKGSDEE